jgi:FkbM family methyltransferase
MTFAPATTRSTDNRMSTHKEIYNRIKSKGITIQCACEVGVYLPETSNVIDFIREGVETILVEPDPSSLAAITTYFSDRKNITLHPVAVYEHDGTITLAKAGASTFVSDLPASPALVNDRYHIDKEKNIDVPCTKFSSIDNGRIDLLSIDTEGCEWYVLKYMTSRPKVISVETHGKYYTNPFIDDIENWITSNKYHVWYKDKSDTVYFREGLMELSFLEKLQLVKTTVYLTLRKMRKHLAIGKS